MLVNLQKEMTDSSLPVDKFAFLLYFLFVRFDTVENVISVPFSGLFCPSVSLSNKQYKQYLSASWKGKDKQQFFPKHSCEQVNVWPFSLKKYFDDWWFIKNVTFSVDQLVCLSSQMNDKIWFCWFIFQYLVCCKRQTHLVHTEFEFWFELYKSDEEQLRTLRCLMSADEFEHVSTASAIWSQINIHLW